jgi:hypothetical protein
LSEHEPPSAIRHCHCSKETAPRAAWRHRSPAWPRRWRLALAGL